MLWVSEDQQVMRDSSWKKFKVKDAKRDILGPHGLEIIPYKTNTNHV